jgi:superkiller protein 3
VQILPRFRDAHVAVAVAQTARLKLNDALEKLDNVLAMWPNEPKAWNLRGYILQTLGRNEDALQAYQRSVECDPQFADGYNNMALLYVERGDVPTAIKMYHRALENDPSLVVALKNLAIIYREAYGNAELAQDYEARAERLSGRR